VTDQIFFAGNLGIVVVGFLPVVTQVCIQNCYRRGGFQQTAETVSDNDDDNNDIPLLHLQNNWCQLAAMTNTFSSEEAFLEKSVNIA
jgi:hypothetical protein